MKKFNSFRPKLYRTHGVKAQPVVTGQSSGKRTGDMINGALTALI